MQVVSKDKPISKREKYRKIVAEIVGTDKAVLFDRKSDMDEFKRIVRKMGFKPNQRKDNGWFVWVNK